ncbi:MAG: PEGA domain-containing protein [Acidobacteriota bacterium]
MALRKTVPVLLLSSALVATAVLPVTAEAHPRPWKHRHSATVVLRPAAKVKIKTPVRRVRQTRQVTRATGEVDVNVRPKSTEVHVDGVFMGTADALDGHPAKLVLPAGRHVLELITPDGVVVEKTIQVRAGQELNVGLDLR